jgi:phospholipase A1/A2
MKFLLPILLFVLLTPLLGRAEMQKERNKRFAILPHAPMFVMPMVYNWTPHEDIYEGIKEVEGSERRGDLYQNRELEFQFSFAIPLVKDIGKKNWDFLASYTHHAYWQVYNSEWSRPFRETNYTPELFNRYVYSSPKSILGMKLHFLDAGFSHQSNGQIQILSRGWNRLFIRGLIEAWGARAQVSGWYPMPEDDNADIYKYMGYGQIELIRPIKKHTLHFKMPILATRPSYDLKYSYPISHSFRFLVSYQSGYGHSLIEYNRSTQRLGVGFLLEDVLY